MLAKLRREWKEKREGHGGAGGSGAIGGGGDPAPSSADADAAAAATEGSRQRARQARLAASSSMGSLTGSQSGARLAPVAEDRAATPFGARREQRGPPHSDDDSDNNSDDDDTDARLLALADEPRFAPFVRQDAYGQGGAGPWTLGECVRLAACCAGLVPLRALVALLCVACYYATCRIASALPKPRTQLGQAMRRTHLARAGRFWSRACLLALGFWRVRWLRVASDGSRRAAGPPWRRKRLSGPAAAAPSSSSSPTRPRSIITTSAAEDVPPPCVVANHLSWLDILVVMARYFPSFVARDGTQDLPLVGLISRQMQCLYVDREKKMGKAVEGGGGAQQQQQDQQQAGNGGGGGGGGSSVGAAVRARMRRAAARSGLLQAMMEADPATAGAAEGASAAAAAAAMENADDAGGDAGAERPMLLFPEGTTSNGRYLLPFRTGAFLAGVPVRPVVLSYSSCGGGLAGGRRPGGVRIVGGGSRRGSGGGDGGGGGHGGGHGGGNNNNSGPEIERYCDRGGGSGGGRLSLAWESITAVTHVLLVLASPWQSATCLELPLCVPSAEERADPRRFAARVRGELLRATALLPSDSGLEDKREYQQKLREVLAARDDKKKKRKSGGGGSGKRRRR
jgi:1-acyl-sn-glycerol-3-phosphate acyltransferase